MIRREEVLCTVMQSILLVPREGSAASVFFVGGIAGLVCCACRTVQYNPEQCCSKVRGIRTASI